MLLDRRQHVGQDRGAARTGDGEEVGKAHDRESEIGLRTLAPLVLEGHAAAPADVDLQQRACHGVEAGGQHQAIEGVVLPAHAEAGRCDALDRGLADVDQAHVGTVEGLPVAGVDAQPLAADDVLRRQDLRGLRILDDLADLGPHEVGRRLVGIVVQQQVGERRHEAQPAVGPALLEQAAALGFRRLDRRRHVDHEIDAGRLGLGALAHLGIVRLDLGDIGRVERLVVRRHGVVGGALEHRQMPGLLGHDRDRLDGGRARADDAHGLAREVDALMRPVAGMVGRPPELGEAVDLRRVGRGQATHGGDDEARRQPVALVRLDAPHVGSLVEHGGGNPGLELDVATQVEAVGDVIGIAQDFGLGRVALRPFPFLLQLGRELVGVLHALHVAARAGITVPIPGAADALPGLDDTCAKPLLAQPVQHIHAAEACADDHRIEIDRHMPSSNSVNPCQT